MAHPLHQLTDITKTQWLLTLKAWHEEQENGGLFIESVYADNEVATIYLSKDDKGIHLAPSRDEIPSLGTPLHLQTCIELTEKFLPFCELREEYELINTVWTLMGSKIQETELTVRINKIMEECEQMITVFSASLASAIEDRTQDTLKEQQKQQQLAVGSNFIKQIVGSVSASNQHAQDINTDSPPEDDDLYS